MQRSPHCALPPPRRTISDITVTYEVCGHAQPRWDLLAGSGGTPGEDLLPWSALVRCSRRQGTVREVQTDLLAASRSRRGHGAGSSRPSLLALLEPDCAALGTVRRSGTSMVAGRRTVTTEIACEPQHAGSPLARALSPLADALTLELDAEHGTILAASATRCCQPLREILALRVTYADAAPPAAAA